MNALDTGIYNLMSGDTGAGGVATLSTGGIFQKPPETATPPYTRFREATDELIYAFGNTIQADHFFYVMQAWAKDTPNAASGPITAGAIADRLRVLFTNPSLTVTGKTVVSCRVDRSLPPLEEWDSTSQAWWYTRGVIVEAWLA